MKIMRALSAIALLLLSAALAQDPPAAPPALDAMRLEFVMEKDGGLVGRYRVDDDRSILISEQVAGEVEAKRMRAFFLPVLPETQVIDAAIAKLRKGEELNAEEVQKCEAEKEVYYNKLTEKYQTTSNTSFNSPDQVHCYLVMIRMAMIDHKGHGGWPFRSTLRLMVYKDLKKITATSKDPYEHFCAVFPSLARRDLDHALQCLKFVQQHDPFLTEKTIAWANRLPESEIKTKFLEATQAK